MPFPIPPLNFRFFLAGSWGNFPRVIAKWSWRAVALAGVAAAILGSGCGRESVSNAARSTSRHPQPEPARVSAAAPGRFGGQLVLPLVGNPQTVNPVLAVDPAALELVAVLFAGLTSMDWTHQEVRPALAHAWEVADDQRTWTFRLRRGLRWSDGVPLTAADAAFTWNEVIYNPAIPNFTAELFRLGGTNFAVRQVDEVTVQVVTPAVFAPLLEFFGSVPVLPAHALRAAVASGRFGEQYGLQPNPPRLAFSGPFVLRQCTPGRSVVLERNPEYWGADVQGRRLPYLERLIYRMAPDPDSALALFLAGECDILERPRPDACGRLRAGAKPPAQWLDLEPTLDREFLWFNLNPGTNPATGQPLVAPHKARWFRDARFRRAVSSALDRERIAREVYDGRAAPALGFVPPENRRWFNPAAAQFGYDPDRARRWLAELGLTDRNGDGVREDPEGRPVEFSLRTNSGNPGRERTAALIVTDLQAVGLRARLEILPFEMLVEQINRTFDYDCMMMGLGGGGLDPATSLNVIKSSEPLHQWFPQQPTPATDWEARLDELMDTLMTTLDYATRKRAFDEVQVILAEQQPMIFTVAPFACVAAHARLANLQPSALPPQRLTWNLDELFLAK